MNDLIISLSPTWALQGQLSSSLNKIEGLQKLIIVNGKALNADIPSTYGSLFQLRTLYIDVSKSTSVSFQVPDLSLMKNLEFLELHGFSGTFPASTWSISSLTSLYVQTQFYNLSLTLLF